MVEFTLIAPLVFFVFLGIIQLTYMAFVFFAVQNAAFSIAHKAAASASPKEYNPALDLIYDLAPLEKINSSLVLTALASQCQIQNQSDQVQLTLRYPMIIWIPLFKELFGEKLSLPTTSENLDSNLVQNIFALAGVSIPLLRAAGAQAPYVHWFVVTASALDENSVPNTDALRTPL